MEPVAGHALPDLERLRERIAPVAERHGLDLVVLHGSRVAGPTHASSDVDLAVRSPDGPLDWSVLGALIGDLQGLLPGFEVDVADLGRADPLLLHRIFERAVPLYQAGGAFDEARRHAWHRYQDYRPYLQIERDAVRRALGLHAG